MNGSTKTTRVEQRNYVLNLWQSLPQRIDPRAASAKTPPVQLPPKPQRVPVTDDVRHRLQEQRERTGLGPSAFLTVAGDRPNGLGEAAIAGWLSGAAKTARADHLAFVLRIWPTLPARVVITEDMREALKAERDRTGVTPPKLLKDDAEAPDQLSCAAIANWLSGSTATALEHHLDYAISKWRSLPDASAGEV